jgi:hypothetical protein
MICTSLLQNHGVMCTDNTNHKIKYSPEKSIVKLKLGDEIKPTQSAFGALLKALFAEIEAKFVWPNRGWVRRVTAREIVGARLPIGNYEKPSQVKFSKCSL